jgi:lytic murein transglycosylase
MPRYSRKVPLRAFIFPAYTAATMADFIDSMTRVTRRALLAGAGGALLTPSAFAQAATFEQWRDAFRARAVARGVSDATYTRVMGRLQPDNSVFAQMRNQPEFKEQLWQYLNRRVSDWRIRAGKEAAAQNAALFSRIEKDFGVARGILLALWGVETVYGDPIVQKNYMRPVFASLAALAWNEPRRKSYWETELINALKIVDKGWGTPETMLGSWAGAMGHTQWMPEVWLNIGMDYDGDGRVSPFGKPDDALGSSANYLLKRGGYKRDQHWGYEVRLPGAIAGSGAKTYDAWQKLGIKRADGQPFPQGGLTAQLWLPVAGGPAFLLGPNFYAVRSYNPSMNYALAICHLGDRLLGGNVFAQPFPGSERALTLEEVQETQTRLTRLGFNTGGTDGRIGNDTMKAVRDFQVKAGLEPDGYAGLKVLERLRKS